MRRHLPTIFRLALLAVAGVFLVRLAREYARDLSSVRFDIDAVGLVTASTLWLASYAFLVRLWAGSMMWWGARVGLVAALRVFAAANIARYIPGGIWQYASMAAMSTSSGLSVAAVASAAVFQQIVLASTGLVLALAFAPVTRLGASWHLPLPVLLAVLVAGLATLVFLLPPLARRAEAWLARRRQMTMTLPRLRRQDVASYVVLSGVGWIGYATAFVLFTHAVLDPVPLDPLVLGASFVLSYVVGILAVFAPGGLIVREAALVALLAPALGGEHALALAIASRLWLVLIDAMLSLFVLIRPSPSVDSRLP
ncbi:MAG: flippase-like domain-containing protein [Cytophagaceae bacterium]|nr:flippase-like domain-containing protein [Gemmatimonadaceae bacterium]